MSKRQRRTTTTTTTTNTNTNIVKPNDTAKLKRQIIDKVLSSKTNTVSSVNLGALSEGWLELESDPGTFSLLVEDLGCFGAQVDEIYDLEQKFDGPVYGFIFLFKWLNNHQQSDRSLRNQSKPAYNPSLAAAAAAARGGGASATNLVSQHQPQNHSIQDDIKNATSNRRNGQANKAANHQNHNKSILSSSSSITPYTDTSPWSYVVDDNIVNEIFFAKQMISNSCATHALISVLLNCDRNELNLGPTLTHLKEHTRIMAPELKGYAIGNVPLIAKAHNSHASFSSLYCRDRPNQQRGSFTIRGNQRTNLQQLQNQPETYHFVSYVPIKNRLYELDGLKNWPIDHGPIDPGEDWTEKFRHVIKQRLLENRSTNDGDALNDIRFNLMAVVPDKRVRIRKHSSNLRGHLQSIRDSLLQLERSANKIDVNHHKRAPPTLTTTSNQVDNHNLPYSPMSNGTLTASETDSVCAAGETHEMETEDMEIPKPPYSPLSTDTLSASETGSVCNSLSPYEEDYILSGDSEKHPNDKYYFIRFDKTVKPAATNNREEDKKIPPVSIDSSDQQRQRDAFKLSAIADMKRLSRQLERDIEKNESLLKEENDKRRKYKIDNSRRTHNYEPFIMTFLSMLARQGKLADLIERNLGMMSERTDSSSSISTASALSSTKSTGRTNQAQPTPSSKPFKQPMPHPPLQPKVTASANNYKTKQIQMNEKPQPEQVITQRPMTSLSGRPIRATKSKYISTGRPRGRPKKFVG